MLALVTLAKSAARVIAWQRLNTDAQYEIVNAYRDGRIWVAVVVLVIVVMLFKQMKGNR